MPVEFDVRQVVIPDGGKPVFVLHSRAASRVTQGQADKARRIWSQAWTDAERPVPPLLIIDSDMVLSALSDAELRDEGLMRVIPGVQT